VLIKVLAAVAVVVAAVGLYADLPTYLAIAALSFATAVAACVAPARRAAGLDPKEALRGE
jgi:ABC-type lipoprotein release transport system permease subunit